MTIARNLVFLISIMALGLVSSALVAKLDLILGIKSLQSTITTILGSIFLLMGAILRFWAVLLFYCQGMKVISLKPQQALITSGPYRFSRNPLYLGVVSIFFGAALLLGSISAVAFSMVVFLALDLWVGLREEKQLEHSFGEKYLQYKRRVPRWMGLTSIKT